MSYHITIDKGLIFRVAGGEQPKGWPEDKEPPEGATDLTWSEQGNGDIEVVFHTPSATEGEPGTETSVTITADEIAALESAAPEPEPPPLRDRLRAYLDAQPAEVRAMFEPLRRPVWDALERGDLEVAKILIQSAEVPADLEDTRDAMLAEFPDT